MTIITDAKDERMELECAEVLGAKIYRHRITPETWRDSLRAALSRAEEAEGKLCRAREAVEWIEQVARDWRDAGDMAKFNAAEYILIEIRRRAKEG